MSSPDIIESDLFRAVFDAIPSIALVADHDVRIQAYNKAAEEFLPSESGAVLKRRTGEVLKCLHSTEVPEGCGHSPSCSECVVRNSVREASQGSNVVRRRAELAIVREEETIEIHALVTASPFPYGTRRLVLLIIEDISEITLFKRMIPICSVCRKVRDDKESWLRIERYFKDTLDVDFSHGYCPECLEKAKAEFESLWPRTDRPISDK